MLVNSAARATAIALAMVAALAGCSASGPAGPVVSPAPVTSAAASPSSSSSMSPEPVGTAMASASPTSEVSTSPTAAPTPVATVAPAVAALDARAWARATLTDVTTGQPFTIASLAGRTIFVEAMAIWCTNCRAQQTRFTEALKRLDPAKVAYVVLTVDPAETAAALAKYKADRGFTGMYAVAGKEVSTALAADFGANALNPPTVPLVLITPTGVITFKTGGETVDQIVKLAGG